MRISDIRSFINEIESLFQIFGFSYVNIGDCYLVSYNEEELIVIPHIENMEFEIPKKYDNIRRIIISETKTRSTNTVLLLSDLKSLANNSEQLGGAFSCIVQILFFNQGVNCLVESIFKNNQPKQKKEISIKDNKQIELVAHNNIIDIGIVERALSINLSKNKKYYSNENNAVVAIVSKLYPTNNYWYGYHDYQIAILKSFKNSYVAYYFKDRKSVLLLPFSVMEEYRPKLNSTKRKDKEYWHIYLRFRGGKCLWQIPNNGLLDVTEYLINYHEDGDSNKNITDNNFSDSNEIVIKIKNNKYHEAKTK